jgi:hypothetical protein
MADLLLDVPKSLSPRKAWMQQHGVLTHWFREAEPGQRCMAIIPLLRDIAAGHGKSVAECMAHSARLYDDAGLIGYGDTLEDALTSLAARYELPTWKGAQKHEDA